MGLCYINGIKKEWDSIDGMELRQFSLESIQNAPTKLFKYFSYNKNSLCSLRNNTVYMQSSDNYNDPYDAILSIDGERFCNERLKYYLKLLNIHFSNNDSFSELSNYLVSFIYKKENVLNNMSKFTNDFNFLGFPYDNILEVCMLLIETFQKNILVYLRKYLHDPVFCAINFALREEISFVMLNLRRSFKSACFTTRNDNLLMWSHYADSHRGFCVEYKITDWNEKNSFLYSNLYPVIYSRDISYITDEILEMYSINLNSSILWAMYKKGLLRKSMDWKYEDEWRLTFIDERNNKEDRLKGYSREFFPISKVYLGANMSEPHVKRIINLCKKNKIEYSFMLVSNSQYLVEGFDHLYSNCNLLNSFRI